MANLPPNTQRIVPYLSYKKAKSAIGFLAKAFGFEVRGVLPGPGESVMHAELGLGDALEERAVHGNLCAMNAPAR
jgi:uncharacterized glyoxalase superfamily protein PhnB